jgi:hypothetical protein
VIAKTTSKVKKIWTNWGTGKNLDMLKVAVDEWKNKTCRYFDSNGEPFSLSQFCNLVSIAYPTFCKYVMENGKIQREIGKSVGHPSIICAEDQIVDVIARYDRGNDGINRTIIIHGVHFILIYGNGSVTHSDDSLD